MAKTPFDLPEFVHIHTDEDPERRSIMYVVEKEFPPRVCPKCGCAGSFYKHDPSERIVQHLPAWGKLVYLKIKTRRYKCRDCGGTFNETFDCIDGQDRLTKPFREHIWERCLIDTFSRIAQEYSLSVNTVRNIFTEHVKLKEKMLVYKAPEVLGIDEDHVHKVFRFVIVDIEGKQLLDIIPDRDKDSILALFKRMPEKQNVKVVCMDMYAPYRVYIKKSFPSAKIVVDRYHVIQMMNKHMDEVRKEARDGMTAAERRQFLYISKLMKSNKEKISDESTARLRATFVRYPALGHAYYLKETIRDMYEAQSRQAAGDILNMFRRSVPANLKPMQTAKATLEEWAEEIMNYFDWRYTNAYTEQRNKFIKEMNRAARGLAFEQLRYKVLFSTKATKLPKFEQKKTTYDVSRTISYMTDFKPIGPQLAQGFGVDIDELVSLL